MELGDDSASPYGPLHLLPEYLIQSAPPFLQELVNLVLYGHPVVVEDVNVRLLGFDGKRYTG